MATSYPKRLQGAMEQMMSESDTSQCPLPTQDITLNLKNRAKAITTAKYGPENPNLPNEAYWKRMADEWDVSVEDAKKSRCGNCAAFNVSDSIKQCIANGIGNEADPWGTIELADLGYCEIFDFKCAGSRSCLAWVVGGPNTGEAKDEGEDMGEGESEDMGED
jgi:hypothetical protein